jgi:hypothetical protein
MGKWTYRDKDQHKHDNPASTQESSVKPGDKWECSCGKEFVVASVRYSGDQRDWTYLLTWREAPEPRRSATEPARNSLASQRDDYFGPYGYGNSQPYS